MTRFIWFAISMAGGIAIAELAAIVHGKWHGRWRGNRRRQKQPTTPISTTPISTTHSEGDKVVASESITGIGGDRDLDSVSILIEVRQSHIDHGQRNSCKACPIGLAMRERLGPFCNGVTVGQKFATVLGADKNTPQRFAMPTVTAAFVERFDFGFPVKPFSFRVSLPAFLANELTVVADE